MPSSPQIGMARPIQILRPGEMARSRRQMKTITTTRSVYQNNCHTTAAPNTSCQVP